MKNKNLTFDLAMSFNMSLINNASSSNAVTKESVQVLSIETRKSFSFGPNVFELNLIESELAALNNLEKKEKFVVSKYIIIICGLLVMFLNL